MTLKLHYNVQPWVGVLTWETDWTFGLWSAIRGGVSDRFTLPALKTKDTKDKAGTKSKSKSKKP